MEPGDAAKLEPREASSRPSPAGEAIGLARRAATGDAHATRQLLEQVAPAVVRAARAVMGGGHPEVEDAVQLALIAFIQALPSFRADCHPRQFAARIAVRTAGGVRRRGRALDQRRDPSVDPDALHAASPDHEGARRREVLRALLDDLPEEQAEALACRVALGWSLKEIADTSGVPLNTVRSRLRLAKEALRRRIEADPALAEELGDLEEDA